MRNNYTCRASCSSLLPPPSSPPMLRALLAGTGLILLSGVVYGTAVEPRFLLDRRSLEMELRGCRMGEGRRIRSWRTSRIGMWLEMWDGREGGGPRPSRRGGARPDCGVISSTLRILPTVIPLGAACRRSGPPLVAAGIPVVAVLGNHDYSLMTKESTPPSPGGGAGVGAPGHRRHRSGNDAVAVPAPGGGDTPACGGDRFRLGREQPSGIGNWPQSPAGAHRVVLMHNPSRIGRSRRGSAPWRCSPYPRGQIRILGPPASWLEIVREGEVCRRMGPRIHGRGGNRLYVNRGIGFSTLPIRINCRPELTLVTLRKAGEDLPRRVPGDGGSAASAAWAGKLTSTDRRRGRGSILSSAATGSAPHRPRRRGAPTASMSPVLGRPFPQPGTGAPAGVRRRGGGAGRSGSPQGMAGWEWDFHRERPIRLPDHSPRQHRPSCRTASLRMVEGPYDAILVLTDVALGVQEGPIVPGLASDAARVMVLSLDRLRLSERGAPPRHLDSEAVVWNGATLSCI